MQNFQVRLVMILKTLEKDECRSLAVVILIIQKNNTAIDER